MSEPKADPTFVTLPQLLEARPFLSERWARALVARGELPHYRLGGRLLFDLAEIDETIRSRRAEKGPSAG